MNRGDLEYKKEKQSSITFRSINVGGIIKNFEQNIFKFLQMALL